VIKTFGVLLVTVLVVSATRDIVCQLACAELGAAHAAAACHEPGEMAGAVVQATDHCTAIDSSPSLAAIKINALQHQGIAVSAFRSTTQLLTLPPTRIALPLVACSPHANCLSVLRI
jgi:hypothetical protein